ncbi:MAG TPA: hypothetical protein VF066_12895 [Thermoleophilaceae bacterium]
MRNGVRIAAAVLTLALAPAAGAESVSYVESGNVFLSTPDGARRVPITTAGTNDSPYTLAGHADSGKVLTSYGGSHATWFIFNPDGTNSGDQPNLVPMKQCGSAIGSVGPIDPRLHPDGDIVAFNYFCNYVGGGHETDLAVDLPKVYTPSSNATPLATDLLFPSFLGKRLLVEGGGNIQLQGDDPNDPFTTQPFNDWIQPDPGESLTRAETARSGGRMVIDETLNSVKQIIIGTYSQIGEFHTACTLSAGAPFDGTFSPDGTKLAWNDSGGLQVGQVDLAQPGCIAAGSVKTLSATGSSPRWSAYTVPEPVQTTTPAGGGTPPGSQTPTSGTGTPQTAPAPTLSVAMAATAKLTQLVKGLVVGYDLNGPGVVESALTMPATLAKKLGVARVSAAQVRLGYARKTVAAAGKGKLTVKLTKKAKKRAKRLKGRTLTLRTTFTPKAGTPVVAVKKLRIR